MAKGKGGPPIGSLNVLLNLNSAKFNKGLRQAGKRLGRFASNLGRSLVNVTKWGAAMGTVAVGSLAVITARTMAAIDAQKKWADRIGISTEGLAGLEHAAALTGLSVQNLRTGLQRSEASAGTGEALKTLRELGVDVRKLNALSPDQQFMAIAEAMKQVKLRGDQVRHTVKIFDMEAAGLVNTLTKGEAFLRDTQLEAQKLGLALTRVDAERVEAATDAVTRLKAIFKGAANILAVTLSPYIKAFSDDLSNLGTRILPRLRSSFERAFTSMAIYIGIVADTLQDAVWRILQFSEVSGKFMRWVDKWTGVAGMGAKGGMQTLFGRGAPEWARRPAETHPGVFGGLPAANVALVQDAMQQMLLGGRPSERIQDALLEAKRIALTPAAGPGGGAAGNAPMTRRQGDELISVVNRWMRMLTAANGRLD
jgi:hypothetical protein